MLTTLIIIGLLGVLIYQDFKSRSVSLIVMILLFGFLCLQALKDEHTIINVGMSFSFNLAFVIMQLAAVAIYFKLLRKKKINFIDGLIGLGDIAFICICAIAFSTGRFLFFYVGSLLLSLLGTMVYRVVKKTNEGDVPLVGYMAIALIFCMVLKITPSSFRFYDDSFLLKFINS